MNRMRLRLEYDDSWINGFCAGLIIAVILLALGYVIGLVIL